MSQQKLSGFNQEPVECLGQTFGNDEKRLEVGVAGFKKACQEREYATIIAVARKIPDKISFRKTPNSACGTIRRLPELEVNNGN